MNKPVTVSQVQQNFSDPLGISTGTYNSSYQGYTGDPVMAEAVIYAGYALNLGYRAPIAGKDWRHSGAGCWESG